MSIAWVTLWLALSAPAAAAQKTPARLVPCQLHVFVRSSLESALQGAAPREGRVLAAETARLIRWRGKLPRLMRRGDRLSVLYERDRTDARATKPVLVAFRYRGERLNMDAYRFRGADGIARYYDSQGTLIEPHMLHAPVPEYEQITEVVQRGRGLRRHRGDDLKAPEGARVVLPFSGTVTRVNWARRHNGQCVEVRLDAGYLAHFLHLSAVDPAMRPGAHLAAGTPVGKVGNTGRSSGAHLHYELLRGQEPVEPLLVHGRRTVRLGPESLTAFVAARDRMAELLVSGMGAS